MEAPVGIEVFTVPEAARALGRAELTFKRWITDELIPAPLLVDTVRGYRHYSAGELRVIARILAQHEAEFMYYSIKHEQTRHLMHQAMQGYRSTSI